MVSEGPHKSSYHCCPKPVLCSVHCMDCRLRKNLSTSPPGGALSAGKGQKRRLHVNLPVDKDNSVEFLLAPEDLVSRYLHHVQNPRDQSHFHPSKHRQQHLITLLPVLPEPLHDAVPTPDYVLELPFLLHGTKEKLL